MIDYSNVVYSNAVLTDSEEALLEQYLARDGSEVYRRFERSFKIACGTLIAIVVAGNAGLIWLIFFS